jgi:uncharacterized protein DUF4157
VTAVFVGCKEKALKSKSPQKKVSSSPTGFRSVAPDLSSPVRNRPNLQHLIGNRAVRRLLRGTSNLQPSQPGSFRKSQAGLPTRLRSGIENLSGLAMDDVRVHYNSSKPAQFQALAHTHGNEIHLGPGQEKHLPHEAWHVAQQKQGRVKPRGRRINGLQINDDPGLEAEADRFGAQALSPTTVVGLRPPPARRGSDGQVSQVIQRKVRTDDGATKVKEAEYQPKGAKAAVGSKRSVAGLIADGVRRAFSNVAELDDYANGKTDYIGDVQTASAGTFWYRLPPNKLTVLGESHENKAGNVEDVVLGLGTSRFMYEPFNEMTTLTGMKTTFSGTTTRLGELNKDLRTNLQVDRKKFNPDLENIVIKAVTGAAITRNEFIAEDPPKTHPQWKKRPSTSHYSMGERTALYLSMAIHIASDISKESFKPKSAGESPYYASARNLKENYLKNQTELDQLMNTKDKDPLIGIFELTEPGGFKNLPAINSFTLVFHEYASRYIAELGKQSGNKGLEAEGIVLSGNLKAKLDDLSPAREEIMWEKITNAKGYLIVGMGDQHRINLTPKLNKAGIPHEEVTASLKRQKKEVNGKWKD